MRACVRACVHVKKYVCMYVQEKPGEGEKDEVISSKVGKGKSPKKKSAHAPPPPSSSSSNDDEVEKDDEVC